MTCWQLRFSTCCCYWAPIGVDPSSVGEINNGKSIYVKLSITWSRGTREYILYMYSLIYWAIPLRSDPKPRAARSRTLRYVVSPSKIYFFLSRKSGTLKHHKIPVAYHNCASANGHLEVYTMFILPTDFFFAEVWEIYRPNPGRSPSPSKSHCFL